SVTDEAILDAYRLLAQEEGVFGEPASAAGVAGLLQASAAGQVAPGSVVVCTITGHGLKDPDTAVAGAPPPITVGVDVAAARSALNLGWRAADGGLAGRAGNGAGPRFQREPRPRLRLPGPRAELARHRAGPRAVVGGRSKRHRDRRRCRRPS